MSITSVQQRALDIYMGQYMRIQSQIERLYGMIDDIRNNIVSTSNAQHRMANILVAQSMRVFSQIEILYDMLNEINDNIMSIIQLPGRQEPVRQQEQPTRQARTNTTSSSSSRIRPNLNSAFDTLRPRVVYDYRTPISPIEYTNTNTNTNTNRSSASSQMSNILSSFLNTSVTIRPTAEQLEAASRLVRYGDITNPLSESCPISMDRFNIDDLVRQIHHCGHLFGPSQFDEWFQSNVRCPVCRFDVRNHATTSQSTATSSQNTIRPVLDPSNNDIVFDLSGNDLSENLLNTLSSRFMESLLYPSTNDDNDRFVYDPSNNILMYETIIRRNTEHR